MFPMSRFLRSELDHFLARLGTMTLPAPHLPVFASPEDPESPISKSTLTKTRYPDPNGNLKAGGWLTEAIFLARDDLRREGKDPDEVFPTRLNERGLERFQFPLVHGFRARWATTMRDLGWGSIDPRTKKLTLDPHVNFLGSWSIETGDTKDDRYVEFDPEILVAIVEMRSAIEVFRKRAPRVAGKVQRDLRDIGAGRIDG